MKFLCPSCKAKYQIADEKVIGRTVKMKCRQCGHLIEINEAVTGNVGQSLGPSLRSTEMGEAASTDEGSAASKTSASAREVVSEETHSGPAVVKAPPKPGTSSAQPGRKPSTAGMSANKSAEKDRSRPITSPIPRVAAAHSMGTRPAVPPKPAPSLAAPAPRAVEKNKSTLTTEVDSRANPAVPSKQPVVPESVSLRSGALAGAFSKAVSQTLDSASEGDHPLAGDEWYIGINDVPIGPIRLAEIRDRAARGEVTQECLVWRDGFEDWKPLSAFPELVAVVEEGQLSFRSLRPSPLAPEPFQPPKAAAVQMHAAPEPTASAAMPAAAGPVVLDEAVLAAAGLSRQKIPLAAWLAVAAALALGVTLGLVLIKPEPPKQVIKYVEVPAKSKESEGDGAKVPALDNARVSGEAAASEQVAAQKQNMPRRPVAQGTGENATASTSPSELSQGLKGLQGLQAGGPRTGPASEPGAASGARQQLDSATLSRTVSRYTASVKRSCWQPALDARAPDAATSARISANIVVAPSGKVQNVTVSPDPKGYRGLSNCIQARVRNWEFPPAGGPTEFNVPFVFAAQ